MLDKVTGTPLYGIREDPQLDYFEDLRTGKLLMKLGNNDDLVLTGRLLQGRHSASKSTVRAKRNMNRRR